jgi:ABC-type transport system involved in multi-copper enzyme maturation permease subunit
LHNPVAICSRISFLPQEPRIYEYITARKILEYTVGFFFKAPQKEIEKRSGTAAWVLSKPGSRTAFVLSKLAANTIGIAVKLVISQGLIAYLITLFALKVSLPVPGYIAALGIHLANTLFYPTLTLLMGVLFDMTGTSVPSYLPLLTALAMSILFVAIALWVFRKQELR